MRYLTALIIALSVVGVFGQTLDLAPMAEATEIAAEAVELEVVTEPDSFADLPTLRDRPEEPSDISGLEIGKSGEYVEMSGDSLVMNAKKISELADPTSESDAATKGYVDEKVSAEGQPKAESPNRKLYRNY